MDPEKEDGNIEYKTSLVDKTESRINMIASQMKYRCDEGNGEAIYVIGVTDSGGLKGVNDEEFKESFDNLKIAADENNYTITKLSEKILENKKKVYELLVRENNEHKYTDIKVAVAGNVDVGKCEAKGTKIRMFPKGIKNIEDIVSGDKLMGDDSKPRTVLTTTKGFGQMYEIIPTKGESLKINKNHILCFQISNHNFIYWDKIRERYVVRYIKNVEGIPKLKNTNFPIHRDSRKFFRKNMKIYETKNDAYNDAQTFLDEVIQEKDTLKHKDIIELSLDQYLKLTKATKSTIKLYRTPIDYNHKDIHIDPYLLGYWLGDGSSSGSVFTTSDKEIVNYISKIVSKYDLSVNSSSFDKYKYYISSNTKKGPNCNYFLNHLQKYNLLNNKHIPDEYKYNSRDIRIRLLAGLIDSDGYLQNNSYDFNMTRKNEVLCDDIIEVIRSCGFASFKKYNVKTCNNGKNGPVKCECIRFGIAGDDMHIFPLVLTRKIGHSKMRKKDALVAGIKDIKILKDQEYYGFELDGNGRYLHEDFTVTHNSSLLGVLTNGKFDNGRGSARLSIFNFKHEVSSGRTSSIAHHILGFDHKGEVTNYSDMHKKSWPDIIRDSAKVINFFDLCGHEKYLKTTIRGLTSTFSDLCLILISANKGITRMTQEHIFLCVTLNIPFAIVITKIDICKDRENMLENTNSNVNKLLKLPGLRRIPYKITNTDDVIISSKNAQTESIVPIFHISNVTGQGIDNLKLFLNLLGKLPSNKNKDDNAVLYIDTTFSIPGVGTVIGGQLTSGTITIGDKLLLGPNKGKYEMVQVRSIHCKRVPKQTVSYGSYVCVGLRKVDRNSIRKGNVLISPKSEIIAKEEFTASITVLKSHSTTIKPGYKPVIHACTVRQAAELLSITDKISGRKGKSDDESILRTGDKAKVKFRFIYQPEYVQKGCRILLAEGRVKIVGVVLD